MLRKCIRASLFAAFGMMAVVLAFGSAASRAEDKKDDKLPDIAEIMKKGHAKSDGYIAKTKDAAKAEKWEDAVKYAKDLNILGEALGKNKPPKGDDKSWKSLTDKYAASTKAALEGAEKKDAKAVNTALGGINCGGCHKAHKP